MRLVATAVYMQSGEMKKKEQNASGRHGRGTCHQVFILAVCVAPLARVLSFTSTSTTSPDQFFFHSHGIELMGRMGRFVLFCVGALLFYFYFYFLLANCV